MIGVFLTGQNTAATIGVAVASIASQNRRPDRVAVVDDGSTDGTAAVAMEGLRGAGFSPKLITLKRGKKAPRVCWPSKRAGFEWLASEGCQYGVAIDTDGDYVPPHYLDRLAIALNGEPNAAMAYPRLVQFGARSGTYQPADTKALDRTNIAPATSMVRLSALQQIGGWAEPYPTYAFCDWATWRRMAAMGWSFTPADTEYFWRRHATSVSFTSPLHQEQWAQTIDWTDLVTIAVPISGREWCLGRLLGSLEKQTVPQSVCRIILLDNSGSPKVASTLRDWLSRQQYRSAQYVAEPAVAIAGRSNAGTADGDRETVDAAVNARVAGNWARIGRLVQTDLTWCVEDDVIPTPDTLERLLSRLNSQLDAVSAAYFCRRTKQPVAWRIIDGAEHHMPRTSGVEAIDGCGLGCVLLRSHVLRAAPLLSDEWYDFALWRRLKKQGKTRVAIDWDTVAQHVGPADLAVYREAKYG